MNKNLPTLEYFRNWRHAIWINRLNAITVKSMFRDTVKTLNLTRLAQELSLFINDHLEGVGCNKIVAFGGGSLGYAADATFGISANDIEYNISATSHFGLMCQTQHAALLLIRDTLKNLQGGKDIPIYLSDPDYTEEDAQAAAQLDWNVTVLNSNVGFQQGWVKLDESTLVVDFHASTPVIQRTFELIRPAAIITDSRSRPGLCMDPKVSLPYSVTVKDWDGNQILIPAMGM